MTKLPPERFPYVYFPDTEYVALPGEKQRPVCLVAHSFNKGRRIERFFDMLAASPFCDPKNTLFVGYNLPSELKTMLSLGWDLPEHCIDLYVEFLNMINGKWRGKDCLKDLGTGLVDAVTYFGGNPMNSGRGARTKNATTSLTTARRRPKASRWKSTRSGSSPIAKRT
jgi:hypothetical protein